MNKGSPQTHETCIMILFANENDKALIQKHCYFLVSPKPPVSPDSRIKQIYSSG